MIFRPDGPMPHRVSGHRQLRASEALSTNPVDNTGLVENGFGSRPQTKINRRCDP